VRKFVKYMHRFRVRLGHMAGEESRDDQAPLEVCLKKDISILKIKFRDLQGKLKDRLA